MLKIVSEDTNGFGLGRKSKNESEGTKIFYPVGNHFTLGVRRGKGAELHLTSKNTIKIIGDSLVHKQT